MQMDPYGLDALWAQGDPVARATLLILAAMSVASWFVLGGKLVEQYRLFRDAADADRAFWEAGSLEEGLAVLAADNPLRILAAAALDGHRRHQGGLVKEVDRHTWLGFILQQGAGRIIGRLQGGLAVLATVGAVAPFIGLFGTVWGIHHALTAIGISGQASIDKVAGPVGEALIMTAIGLAVAVPAVLGYNWLVRRNKVAADSVRAFAADLHAVLLGGRRPNEAADAGQRQPCLLARSA